MLAALALSACATTLPPADRPALESAVASYYAHYLRDDNAGPSDWELPIYTAETTALIARWREAEAGSEGSGLESFGWLCECQDWDAAAFSAAPSAIEQLSPTRARVSVDLHPGWDARVTQVLDLRRENGRWLIHDLRSPSIAGSLRRTLQAHAR